MNTRDYSRLQGAFVDRVEIAAADWWPERRRVFDATLAKIEAGQSPLVVQGAAGVGKSAFLTSLLEALEPIRNTSLVSAADVPPTAATATRAAEPHDSDDDSDDAPADCARPGVLLVDDLHLAEEWWVRRIVAPCPDCPAPDASQPRPLLVATTGRRALRAGLPGLGGEGDIGADNCIALNPMTRTDVEAFVEARLSRAGYDGPPPFTEEAMDRIEFYSRGLPGRVTRLCHAALTVAAEREAWPVGEALVREVAWSLFLPDSLKNRLPALGHIRPEAGPAPAAAADNAVNDAAGADPDSFAASPVAAVSEPIAAPAGRGRRSAARRLAFAAIACFALGIGIAVHVATDGAGPVPPAEQVASTTARESPPAGLSDAGPDVADQPPPEPASTTAPEHALTTTPEAVSAAVSESTLEPAPAAIPESAPDMARSDASEWPELMVTEAEGEAPVPGVPLEDGARGPTEPLPQAMPQEVLQEVLPDPEESLPTPAVAAAPQEPAAVIEPDRKRRPPTRARAPRRAPSDRVVTAQALLAQLGFSPGPVDGAEGPQTRRAIRAYQARHGLAVTGAVDDRVLASLRRDAAAQRSRTGSSSLLTSVIRTISATVGPRVDSVEDPGSVVRYCRNNRDTWVFDFGKDRPVFCKYIDQPGG